MPFTDREILETVRMIELETLDIRTTTLGIDLLDVVLLDAVEDFVEDVGELPVLVVVVGGARLAGDTRHGDAAEDEQDERAKERAFFDGAAGSHRTRPSLSG